jgi:hypothetical protein
MTNSTPHTLIFRVTGDSLAEVIRWQQATDLFIMRYLIEQGGSAPVIRSAISPDHIGVLSEPLPPGEALPWYGTFGGGYSFEFRPQAGGAHLRAVNEAGGHELFYPEPLPPLELDIPTPLEIRTEPEESGQLWYTSEWGWWYNGWADRRRDGLRFVIEPEFCRRLVESGWDVTRPDVYTYRFIPLSVGCEIFYHDIRRGLSYHLTNDVCW